METISRNQMILMIAIAVFFLAIIVIFYIYRFIYKRIQKRVLRTTSTVDDFILTLFKVPVLWLIYWIMLKVFSHIFLREFVLFPYLQHINTLLLIFAITWIIIQAIKAGTYFLQSKLEIDVADNLNARKSLTQINVFKGIANTIVIIIAISIGLLTFEQARTIGLSLLTSAGVIGIIVGFAAQKSIGMILAGIQLAITQPIRLDDVVIIEDEWGRIEEITLTYVVVKVWDERRLILPVNYFLEKSFQNWTRKSAEIIGTVFLYLDYSFPVEELRMAIPKMLDGNDNWDGRVFNVQVTKTNEQYQEVRILLSSSDASKNWDLRASIRENVITFINQNFPDSFAKLRIKTI